MKKVLLVVLIIAAYAAIFAAGFFFSPFKREVQHEIEEAKHEIKEEVSEIIPPSEPASADKLISEEEAKKIALDKAGLTEGEVKFVKAELDRDDGIIRYEIEFRKDLTEYDAEINAETGEILSWETDYND